MPAAARLSSAIERQLLIQLGERLRRLRQERQLTTVALARLAGISRMTLSAVESGEPAPAMGTYLRVMSALGVAGDLALVAGGALLSDSADQPGTTTQARIMLNANDTPHDLQDLQSLILHEEAVKLARKQPALIDRALGTLEKWRSSGGPHSQVLWDEWSVILRRRDWRRVLSRSARSRELRQASPLTVALPTEVRERLLNDIREIRQGVPLGYLPTGSALRKRQPRSTT